MTELIFNLDHAKLQLDNYLRNVYIRSEKKALKIIEILVIQSGDYSIIVLVCTFSSTTFMIII